MSDMTVLADLRPLTSGAVGPVSMPIKSVYYKPTSREVAFPASEFFFPPSTIHLSWTRRGGCLDVIKQACRLFLFERIH
jgi:hypothetical protein